MGNEQKGREAARRGDNATWLQRDDSSFMRGYREEKAHLAMEKIARDLTDVEYKKTYGKSDDTSIKGMLIWFAICMIAAPIVMVLIGESSMLHTVSGFLASMGIGFGFAFITFYFWDTI